MMSYFFARFRMFITAEAKSFSNVQSVLILFSLVNDKFGLEKM